MDLRAYLGLARAHWLLIVAAALAGAMLGVVLSVLQPRVYVATAQNFVSISGTDLGTQLSGSGFALQRVKSYVNVVESEAVLVPVIEQLGLDLTPAQLRQSVSAANPPQTVLLNITATGPDPDLAAALANAVAARYAEVVEALETPPGGQPPVKVTPVMPAQVPGAPTSPRTRVNVALGLLLGLGAGVAAALLRERLNTAVRSPGSLVELAGAPLLGVVPADDDPLPALSSQSEAFRTIRTNLTFIDVDDPPQVIAVTSGEPGAGKTTLAVNLAIALSQAGRRVCLVDADLRTPTASERLGVTSAVGLTSVLTGEVSLSSAVVPWRRGAIAVLPAGDVPPNPSELLDSEAFADVLDCLRATYQIVVVDAAPLLPVADGALAASAADGAVLVARFGRTSAETVGQSRTALQQVDARLLGVVLNGIPAQAAEGYGYGYGYEPEVVVEDNAQFDQLLR
jgi:capsular exopolysaccharide synthesis family protein